MVKKSENEDFEPKVMELDGSDDFSFVNSVMRVKYLCIYDIHVYIYIHIYI